MRHRAGPAPLLREVFRVASKRRHASQLRILGPNGQVLAKINVINVVKWVVIIIIIFLLRNL